MDEKLKSNLTSGKHWMRFLYMVLFVFILQVAAIVMWALVIVQFLFALITGKDNRNLRKFGDSLSQFIYQSLQFLVYKSDEKPFPFSDWPESDVVVDSDEAEQVAEEEVHTYDPVKNTVDEEPVAEPATTTAETEIKPETESEIHTETKQPPVSEPVNNTESVAEESEKDSETKPAG